MTEPAAPSPFVLVVDDDPDIVEVIKGALEDEGLTVETATDGGQALAAASRRQPDLVVLDVTLPVVDGFEVAARLRGLQQRNAPVLAITADGQAAQKARRLGAYAYLRKPFELSDLIAVVWRGLGGQAT